MAYLLAWLQKHKEYPRAARFRHQEGTAMLYFEMDRSGRVMLSRLHRSSGHALLDREVLALIARAAPLPPPPDDIPGERVQFVVPIQFDIR
jgi:periplasmic protein TonB